MFGIGYVIKQIEPCTRARFYEAIDSKLVADTCALIARMEKALGKTTDKQKAEYYKREIGKAKRMLPCITPMATFKNNKRSIANAIASGMNMIDVDHVDDPRQLWEQIKKTEHGCKIALVHVTPSTHGLRIIFRQPEGISIADAQADMARRLNVDYDQCTKDLSRCSFLVPRSYILEMNEETLFEVNSELLSVNNEQLTVNNGGASVNSEQLTVNNGRVSVNSEQLTVNNGRASVNDNDNTNDNSNVQSTSSNSLPSGGPGWATFHSIPYSEIVQSLLFSAGYDNTPAEGERNNALYLLARNLRYVCDFDAQFIRSVVPDWGLPSQEVQRTIESAVKSVRKAVMPMHLTQILQALTKHYAKLSEQGYNEIWDHVVECEGLLGKIVNTQPRILRNAAYITAITCFGTLFTRLRGHGCDGEMITPTFMTCVSAPQATGKSFMKRIYKMVVAPIITEDARQRKILNDIEKENKRNRDKEDYEEKEFDGAIRLLPSNVSNRMLLERMDKAKGQHIMIMAEEIDSITKAEKSGKWSEKSDIYRLAYDNSDWGQDYANENSYHAIVPLFLNLLFSGTPAAVSRFFNDIENGLITRFLFIDLPDTFGQKRPKASRMSEEDKQDIEKQVQTLYDTINNSGGEDGTVWMDTTEMVRDITERYDEVQRRSYLVNQDEVCRDLARRRYADYGVKMMMIETYLNGGIYTESIRDRVLKMTEYVTEQLIAMHGDAINKSLNESSEKHEDAKVRSKKVDVLESLPSVFTTQEYCKALTDLGLSSSSGKTYLTRLVRGGVLETTERGIYRKL